jgi:hypothetical protein
MKDVLALIFALYHSLHRVAPSSDAGKRWLNDIAGYALYSLMSRLTRRGLRPTARDEAVDYAYASIVGVGCRAGGPGWLEDQLARVFTSLSSPTRRSKLTDAEKAWASDKLSAATKAKAAEIRARLGAGSAERVVDSWDSAEKLARQMIASVGTFSREREIDAAPLDGREMAALVEKTVRHVREAAGWYASIDDIVSAVLVEEYATSDEFADLIAEYEVDLSGGWVPPHEIGSEDFKEEGNLERRYAEMGAIRAEVMARSGTRDE